MIEHTGDLPEQGQEYTTEDGVRLVVDAVDKNRIQLIHIYLPLPQPNKEEDEDD